MSSHQREASAYFELAAASPVLDRETELALATKYQQTGCPKAAERLSCSMLRFVITVAVKYARSDIPLSDLISEGMVGVMKALKKFEPERGLRFVTFASYWVRAEIGTSVFKNQSLVRSATLRPRVLHKLRRERRKVYSQFGDSEQGRDVLAERMEVDRAELDVMLARLDLRDVSLEGSDNEEGLSLIDQLAADGPTPEDVAARSEWEEELPENVRGAIEHLDPREKFIAEARLLACPDEELSLADVGRELKVTRERARQLEVRTKAKLRVRLTSQQPSQALAA